MVLDVIPNVKRHSVSISPSFAEAFSQSIQEGTNPGGRVASSMLGAMPEDIRRQTSTLIKQLWDVIDCCNTGSSLEVSTLLAELVQAICAVDEDVLADPNDSESLFRKHNFVVGDLQYLP
jgi:hypothetical protein